MKGKPENMQASPKYRNCTSQVYEFLFERKEYAKGFGIEEEYIAVDPGPGFGKTEKHNIELIKNMSVFSSLGAVVGAVSRKRFIRTIAGENKEAFIAANFLAVLCGANIVRVHDVKETINVLKMGEIFRRA
jgi:dihydropteroate synthase